MKINEKWLISTDLGGRSMCKVKPRGHKAWRQRHSILQYLSQYNYDNLHLRCTQKQAILENRYDFRRKY